MEGPLERRAEAVETDMVWPREERVTVTRAPKAEAVYDALRRRIVIGRLPQGAPLVEMQLAGEFGCSQGVIREALFRLQEDGLVVREGYRGTSVSRTSLTEAHELLALRRRLETQGVCYGLLRLDAEALGRLARQVEVMERLAANGDLYPLTDADRTFHLTIFAASDLPGLEPILERCFLLLHRYALTNPARKRSLLETARRHWAIVEALETRDPAQAARALGMHIDTVVEGLPPLEPVQGA
jgi:DNA-binding GntR family transcriptional regulator